MDSLLKMKLAIRCMQIGAVMTLLSVVGCQATPRSKTAADLSDVQARRVEARRLNAAALSATEMNKKRELLERAVQLDDLYGEGHQNLGVVYFQMGDLYKSATELQEAANMLSGSPEPYANLAVLHGSLEQWDRALQFARLAYERDAHSICAQRVLARSLRETRSDTDELKPILERLGSVDPSTQWRKWANEQLFQMADRRTQIQ